jgi:hypothetical protein
MNLRTLEEIKNRRGKPVRINDYQRLVLFAGAIALALALWTSPKVVIWEGIYFRPEAKRDLMPMTEPRTASMRVVGVMGASLLIFFALKDYKPKQEESQKVPFEEIITRAKDKSYFQEMLPISRRKLLDLQEILPKLEDKVVGLQEAFLRLWKREKAENEAIQQ